MKHIGKFAILAALTSMMAGAGLVATTAPAAAFIACNHRGNAGMSRTVLPIRRAKASLIHPDDWHWGRHTISASGYMAAAASGAAASGESLKTKAPLRRGLQSGIYCT